MADAWGGSWGSSWGSSWSGSGGTTPPPPSDEGTPPELGGGKIVATGKADNRTTATAFTRERYRALRAALEAEARAREQARTFKRKKDRKAAEEAVREVEAALEAARDRTASTVEAVELRAAADLLRGASRTKALGDFLAQVEQARLALAVAYRDQVVRALEEEDEDEAIALLLAG